MTDDGQMMWRIDPGRGWPLDEDEAGFLCASCADTGHSVHERRRLLAEAEAAERAQKPAEIAFWEDT